ncbi:MAG: SPOR domain-containing protein [Bacteroides sp.]|nr:SPOR domain-containing protein [Bacteroides sp.]MCM1086136.1 SPOR domain-containing protein [Bacteroides sp.]
MNVAEYLRKFLSEQPLQEAAVPGLGVFYNGQHEGRNRILFKEIPPVDKAFLNYFAFEENLGEEEAKAEVEKWVRRILSDLKGNGNVRIENIGAFDITGGKVVFTPTSENIAPQNQDFGLEAPAPALTAEPAPVPAPAPEPRPVAPAPVERPRPTGNVRRPLNPPVKKPQPNMQPTSSGKGLVLGDRKKPAAPAPRRPNEHPFYSQWWFILVCVLAVLSIVLFGIRPVREKVTSAFKPKTTEMQVEEKMEEALNALVEGLDMMIDEETAPAKEDERERQVAEENAEIARQVKAGQEQKQQQEAQAKKAQQAKEQPKPAARPAQPKAQPAKTQPKAQPAAKPAQKADVQKPVAGKYYLIVGGFAVENNARNKYNEMRANGYSATLLYLEAKNMYYVSVKTCADKNEALSERAAFRNRNVDCWIFAN